MLDPPVPVSATHALPLDPVVVTFSHPLVDAASIDVTNWFVRENNLDMTVTIAKIVAGVVELTLGSVVADIGPDVVSFTPPPSDVLSDTTRQVAAPGFADFPLV